MNSQVPRGKIQNAIYALLSRWLPESWLTWFANCFAPEPIYPFCVELTTIEKAKMDYEHRLKAKEMRWEKGVFALVLALVGAWGYYKANKYLDENRAVIANTAEQTKADIAKAAEETKTKESNHRLLLDKQLPELVLINSAISDVTRVYFPYARGKKAENEQKVRDEYKVALERAREAINRSPFLFDLDFNKDLDRYFEIHRKLSQLPIEQWAKYREFAEDLSNRFDDLCRSVLDNKRGDPKSRERMGLNDETLKKIKADATPKEYIDAFYKAWAAKQKNEK